MYVRSLLPEGPLILPCMTILFYSEDAEALSNKCLA